MQGSRNRRNLNEKSDKETFIGHKKWIMELFRRKGEEKYKGIKIIVDKYEHMFYSEFRTSVLKRRTSWKEKIS